MAFFDEAFDRFGPDALPRLLFHRLDDFLDVFGGGVEILMDFLLLFGIEDGRAAAPGTIL
jgi:hypothetical protein